jgi:hypothetical protein
MNAVKVTPAACACRPASAYSRADREDVQGRKDLADSLNLLAEVVTGQASCDWPLVAEQLARRDKLRASMTVPPPRP